MKQLPSRMFQVGDRVRDCTKLGGEAVETWGRLARVDWGGGLKAWIGMEAITLDTKHDSACGQ